MWLLHMTFIILIFTFKIIIPQLFSRNLKLSILSNHAKYLKGLVPIVCYTYYPFLHIFDFTYKTH